MRQFFKCTCPECGREVLGSWDWEKGDICVMGECACGNWVLEEEGVWKEV